MPCLGIHARTVRVFAGPDNVLARVKLITLSGKAFAYRSKDPYRLSIFRLAKPEAKYAIQCPVVHEHALIQSRKRLLSP